RNVIYEFYGRVDLNKYGVPGDDGDKHYKCLHGASKIITVKRSQKHSVNGLVGHLQRRVPPMHRLYEILKGRSESPTQDELDIAAGKKHLDTTKASAYLGKLETASNSILAAFRKQAGDSVPFDQEIFEKLLIEWMVADDQAFDLVENKEFQRLLQ
ncbi:hypothetical protein B0H13DRAFT_1516258, partial [Mycena leptocephala]